MTAFCGVVALTPAAPEALATLGARLKKNLSRFPGEAVQTYQDARATIHWYRVGGAPPDASAATEACDFSLLCGEPLGGRDGDVFDLAALRSTRGSFCAVSWRRASFELQLVADKLALRPIYVWRDNCMLVFATNLRAIKAALDHRLTIDAQGLSESIAFGYPLGTRTALADVSIVDAGERLIVDAGGVRRERYHTWTEVPRSTLNYDETLDAIYASFIEATRLRIIGDTSEAFLSGGMDSRCVVAGLIDAGQQVRSFNSSYPNSADDIVGRQIAAALGTEHHHHLREPRDRVKFQVDPFAYYARDHFPAATGVSTTAGVRRIWTGDGGSVGMGHVYLDAASVALAADARTGGALGRLFPRQLATRPRILNAELAAALARHVEAGLLEAMAAAEARDADRTLFVFYLLNDQKRHLYQHYENIDLGRIEFVTPFFDSQLLEMIVAAPIDWFLLHRFYNDWIGRFRAPAATVSWQVYPGHLPGPHPLPDGITEQWDTRWYTSRDVLAVHRENVAAVLRRGGRRTRAALNPTMARLVHFALLVGSGRWAWQAGVALQVYQSLDDI